MSGHTDVSKVRKLGRGLSALLQTPVAIEVAPRVAEAAVSLSAGVAPGGGAAEAGSETARRNSGGGGGVEQVLIEAVRPSPFQARRVFDEAPLRTLAESIRVTGVMQPVIVRMSKTNIGTYELIAGERRWRAAKIAGLTRLPAIVRELADEEAAEWGLIENLQREDLNAMDRAHGLRMMHERFGLSHARVAEKVGLERATVANLIRLTELEPEIAELISADALTSAHGKSLLSMAPGADRVRIAREAARNEWPVRKIEAEVKRALSGGQLPGAAGAGESMREPAGSPRDVTRAVLLDLERRLSQQLGTKVGIQSKGAARGEITIEYYGLDHFDGLMNKLGLQ